MADVDLNTPDFVRAAAERGVSEAQAIYGQMLLDGTLVPRNATAALHWFERAARGGQVMAINMVGRCLDQGWGVVASPCLAAQWFRKAADKGLDWGMYNFATLLTLGRGVTEDKVEALHWFRKAAEQDHAKSINLLGSFYEDGWVVQHDLFTARALYQKAAVAGDFRGQFNYARLLLQDGQVADALTWLHKVPKTATPAFVLKMKRFLLNSSRPEVHLFAVNLPADITL
ncbi:MAG: tetratricopeptide repeat protein [Janthinobacterium lividum]